MTEQERELTAIRRVKEFLALPDEAKELVVLIMRTLISLYEEGVTWDDLRAGRVVLDKSDE